MAVRSTRHCSSNSLLASVSCVRLRRNDRLDMVRDRVQAALFEPVAIQRKLIRITNGWTDVTVHLIFNVEFVCWHSVNPVVIRLKHGRRHPVFEENRTGCSYSVRMDRATGYLPMVPRSSFDCSRSATRFSEIQNPRSFCCRYRVNGRARNIRTTYATFPPHSPVPFLYVFCRAVTLAFHPRGSRLHRLRRLTPIEYTTLTKPPQTN